MKPLKHLRRYFQPNQTKCRKPLEGIGSFKTGNPQNRGVSESSEQRELCPALSKPSTLPRTPTQISQAFSYQAAPGHNSGQPQISQFLVPVSRSQRNRSYLLIFPTNMYYRLGILSNRVHKVITERIVHYLHI